MKDANPIALVDDLKRVLERYTETTLPISRRYPNLGDRFREILSEKTLIDGPYVEALPDFEKGSTLESLLIRNGGFINDAMGKLPTAARKLHMHQQTALELAGREGKSLLVATGTGSGKTETFLYPIADALLSEKDLTKPGVRALLVYPMNALANDQLYYRIAPLFGSYLKEHGITFGRYTGQVRANVGRDDEEAKLFNNQKLMETLGHPDAIPSNWLLTREEMLKDPPKVLITNYAMLEHLLLLPRNQRLFAADALKFIVLDEIHTYHGAQATEVAFLLRKLKNRLGITRPLQVFGTSASLADGKDADERLKEFATGLFGEDVHDVVRGKRVVHDRLKAQVPKMFSLSIRDWVMLGKVISELLKWHEEDRSVEAWNLLLESNEFSNPELVGPEGGHLLAFLEERFAGNKEIRRIADLLDNGGVIAFRELADRVFESIKGDDSAAQRYQALSSVIQMGMLARRDENGFPLLPGRYHIAVNSIEGLAALPAATDEGWSKLVAARHYRDADGIYYPLLTCRKCGQPFLEGYEVGGTLHNRRPDDRESHGVRRVFWLGNPVGFVEDEEDEAEEGGVVEYQKYSLMPSSGELIASDGAVPLYAIKTEEDEQEKVWYVRKCPACGGMASGAEAEVVTKMHPGSEALGAVVAQRVLEALPAPMVDHSHPRPAQGRNLLTFSDNRQDAAFFAPYFERTSADLALRSAIRNVLKGRTSPLTAPQLAEQIFQYWQRDGQQAVLIDSNGDLRTDHHDLVNMLLGSLGAEFCTPGGRRNSVETLGVVNVTYDEGKLLFLKQKVKSFWIDALPNDDTTISAMIHILLESVRRERALSKFHGVPLRDAHIWGTYDQHRSFDIDGGDENVKYKWLPSQNQASRHNRRTWYLIEQLGLPREQAFLFLRQFWEALVKPPIALLERHNPGFALNGDYIRFGNGDLTLLYVCKSCGLAQQHSVLNKCIAFRCRGELELISNDEKALRRIRNHYLASYEESEHTTVRAREHTASLSTELREGIERDFADRTINLLSCTTTMEMGVDLGDLEAVVNLNVPPGIANYQQRTGRAGRRAQAAPFCVTVARNTNFDQAVFRTFKDYLASSPGTPFIHLDNQELFKRHQFSVLLAHFMRNRIAGTDINAPSMKHLFGETFDKDALKIFTENLLAWTESDGGAEALKEAEMLIALLPASLQAIGAKGMYLRNLFVGVIREFAEEVSERFVRYIDRQNEAAAAADFKKASYWQRMCNDFMDQFLVNQLSRRGLIPTYSFPVHSLTLEVVTETTNRYGRDSDVALSRDASLGISEYAPGAEVVANGRIWESAGLVHYPKAFMPERWYVACPECFHVDIDDVQTGLPTACSNCGATDRRRKRKFIEPHGFVTNYSQRKGRDPGSSRRRVKPADEARLIAAPREDAFQETDLPFLISAFLSARNNDESGLRGSLFIANRGAYGEGYHRCLKCNYCEPIKPASKIAAKKPGKPASKEGKKVQHSDPQNGQICSNDMMSRVGTDFVHRFDTDVRLFRFISMLPMPEDLEIDSRRFHERVARTIAEGVRLAVSDMLDLYPGEVRAIYRLYGNQGARLEVVLYDAIPGGAGYCSRIGEPGFSFDRLIRLALKHLDCPSNCEAGCRSCLYDYSNQRWWDDFERKQALSWLANLVEPNQEICGPGGYVRWQSPSQGGLVERLASYDRVSLVARSLVDSSGFAEEALDQVIRWAQDGKTLRIYLANKLEEKPRGQTHLTAYRRLHPYVSEGRIELYALGDRYADKYEVLPRIFVGHELKMPLVRQHFAVRSLLEGLISAPADIGAVDAAIGAQLEQLTLEAERYSTDVLSEGEKMQMWELESNAPRRLDDIFSPLKGAFVKCLDIRDPYCATLLSTKKLEEFLRFVLQSAKAVSHLEIWCRENRDKDGYVEFYIDVQRRVDDLVKTIGFQKWEVNVAQLKGARKSFHDRELDITTVDDEGCEQVHRYFLTGGIDFLMDERAQTKVFYLRIDP